MKNIFGFITLLLFGVVFFFACDQKEDTVKPVAGFTLAQDEVFIGDAVEITNTSKDAAYYSWDFGNGTYSSETNPEIVYTIADVYTIKLEALNKGEIDTYTKQITVIEPEPGSVIVSITSVDNITANSASCVGKITTDQNVDQRGFVWNTSDDPTIDNSLGMRNVGTGDGIFESIIGGLSPSTKYYVRAYAQANGEYYYSSISKYFTTSSNVTVTVPTVETFGVSDVFDEGAMCGGKVSENGGSLIVARGVCYSTSQDPKIDDAFFTVDGGGLGEFTSKLINLEGGTTYYVKAYATNSQGTGYGEQQIFTTPAFEKLALEASFTSVAPVIDGDIDDIWATVKAHKMKRTIRDETVSFTSEPTFKVMWDNTNIYVLVEVPDDNFYTYDEAGVETWMADKPGVYLDLNEIKEDGIGPDMGNGHYIVSPNFDEGGWDGLDFEFNVNNDASYICEYSIRFSNYYTEDGTMFNPYTQETIGFDVEVTDLDKSGFGENIERGRAIWSNSALTDENWTSMDDAGTLTFVGGTPNEVVVIFDPETYDQTTLPDGMEIIEFDGVYYLQVITDGWNMELDIPDVALTPGQTVRAETKYIMGKGTALSGISMDSILFNCLVKDYDNQIPDPWNPTGTIASFFDLMESPVTQNMGVRYGVVESPFQNAQVIQFWAQIMELDWPPTYGDTILVGKITAQ